MINIITIIVVIIICPRATKAIIYFILNICANISRGVRGIRPRCPPMDPPIGSPEKNLFCIAVAIGIAYVQASPRLPNSVDVLGVPLSCR